MTFAKPKNYLYAHSNMKVTVGMPPLGGGRADMFHAYADKQSKIACLNDLVNGVLRTKKCCTSARPCALALACASALRPGLRFDPVPWPAAWPCVIARFKNHTNGVLKTKSIALLL